MSARCGQALNAALHEIFERDERVYLIGEDLLDPYAAPSRSARASRRGGPTGCSTPVSEASIFGITAGLALRGYRPILEIMFGDFVALGLDQVVNGIAKFRAMFDDRVDRASRRPHADGRHAGATGRRTASRSRSSWSASRGSPS